MLKSATDLDQNYRDLIQIHIQCELVFGRFSYFNDLVTFYEMGEFGHEYSQKKYYPNAVQIFTGMAYILANTKSKLDDSFPQQYINYNSLKSDHVASKLPVSRENRDIYLI